MSKYIFNYSSCLMLICIAVMFQMVIWSTQNVLPYILGIVQDCCIPASLRITFVYCYEAFKIASGGRAAHFLRLHCTREIVPWLWNSLLTKKQPNCLHSAGYHFILAVIWLLAFQRRTTSVDFRFPSPVELSPAIFSAPLFLPYF
jgi:hypothetical protein